MIRGEPGHLGRVAASASAPALSSNQRRRSYWRNRTDWPRSLSPSLSGIIATPAASSHRPIHINNKHYSLSHIKATVLSLNAVITSLRDEAGLHAIPVTARLISAAKKTILLFFFSADLRCSSCPQKVDAVAVTDDHDAPTSQSSHHAAGSCHILPPMMSRRFPGKDPLGCCLFCVSAEWWDRWRPLAARQEHYYKMIATVCIYWVH